jgi:hypothetical protein
MSNNSMMASTFKMDCPQQCVVLVELIPDNLYGFINWYTSEKTNMKSD